MKRNLTIIRPVVLFFFVLLPSNSWSNELLDMAKNGPRYFKITTVIDCRRTWDDNQSQKHLTVFVIDITNRKAVVRHNEVSDRSWSIFEYSIRDNTDIGSVTIYDIDDSKGHSIYFNYQGGDWVFWKHSLRLESEDKQTEFKCRYL